MSVYPSTGGIVLVDLDDECCPPYENVLILGAFLLLEEGFAGMRNP